MKAFERGKSFPDKLFPRFVTSTQTNPLDTAMPIPPLHPTTGYSQVGLGKKGYNSFFGFQISDLVSRSIISS